MDDLNKLVKYNSLLLIYQELLSKTQKEILTDYFAFNLSISEIATNREVSRAAVEDAIKKGQAKLDELENALGVYSKNSKIRALLESLRETNDDKEKNSIIEEIERIIK